MDIRKKKIKGIFVLTALLILCLCGASVLSFFTPNKTVNAITEGNIASQSTNLGEMLLDGYENDPTGIGKIFDGDVFWELVSQISGVSNPNESTLDNLTMPKTSADFRANNNALGNGTKDLVVQIGKKKWIATYLSTNDSGEPILTLWLADSSTIARWNENSTNKVGKYPSSMYGTSEMRAVTLNNGGGYAVNYDDTSLKPVSQNPDSEWAIFTVDKTQKAESIKEFIEVPDNMSWQHNQVAKGNVTSSAYTAKNNYNNNNDALDIGGSYSSTYNYLTHTTVDKDGYKGWANDTLWLPSLAETGVYGEEGIWKAADSTRANSKYMWVRSANFCYFNSSYILNPNGSGFTDNYVYGSYAVRPAFHLNLAKVKEFVTLPTPQVKGDAKKYYDKSATSTFELENIDLSKTNINIVAKDMDGNSITAPTFSVGSGVLSFSASEVGEYTVQVTPKSGECWSDGNNDTKEYKYKIVYRVTPMRFASSVNGLVYKGSEHYLEVENYDENLMTLTLSTGTEFGQIPAGESNAGKYALWALNAGNGYKATVSLKNTDFMEWTDNTTSPKSDLTFDISKKALTVLSTGLWSTEVYTGKEYEVSYDCSDSDIGKLRFSAYYTGGGITTEEKIDDPLVSQTDKKLTVRLPRLSDKGTYKYILKLADGIPANQNYTLTYDNNFTVGNKQISLTNADIVWRYANTHIAGGAYNTIRQSDLDANGVFNVDYNGADYVFEVDVLALKDDVRDSIEYEYTGELQKSDVETSGAEYLATFKIKAKNGNTSIDILTPTFTLKWKINKIKFDFSKVKWNYDAAKPFKYNENPQTVKLDGLPAELENCVKYGGNSGVDVMTYHAVVQSITITDSKIRNNYVLPIIKDTTTYIYNGDGNDVEWELDWDITIGSLNLEWGNVVEKDDPNGKTFEYPIVSELYKDYVKCYEYYRENDYVNGVAVGAPINLDDITVIPEKEERYWAVAVLADFYNGKYEITGLTKATTFSVGSYKKAIVIKLSEKEYEYDAQVHGNEWTVENGTPRMVVAKYYALEEDGSEILLDGAPVDAGKYVIRFEVASGYEAIYEMGVKRIAYEITKAKIKVEWNTEGKNPEISGLSAEEKEKIEYEYYDENGNSVEESELESGNTYKVVAKIKDEHVGNYEFVDGEGVILAQPSVSGEYEFEYKDDSEDPSEPDDPNNPNNPINPDDPNSPDDPDGDNNNGGSGNVDFDKAVAILKEWWQAIASGVSIVLILLFTAKGIGYASKRKENKKTVESKYKTFYATTGLFGLSMTNWTVIASVLMGVAVLSFVFMLIEKRGYKKSVRELEDAKDEYNKMMLMHMMGNNGNMQGQGYAYAQPAIGMEDMRGMINEAVSAMLPNVQQYLPQQASANEELVQKLIEQNAQNEERIRQLTEENKETIKKMSERNDERIERFLQKLTEQKPVEKTVEKEVAATVVANDEIIKTILQGQKEIMEKLSKQEEIKTQTFVIPTESQTAKANESKSNNVDDKDGMIRHLLQNQEMLMKQIIELSANKGNDKPIIVQQPAPQIVEKVVEKPVEKIVEKEVVKEVKVEVPVEKPAAKVVPLAVEKPTPKERVTSPRLTLDEAYAKLSAKQKKFFDTLKEYAMSKDKCKEKKSTYYILLGQSSVNPLVKLTIKKDCTVALFKMEDEYMKDIRRNATNDGTKVKVKETELIVGDAQALATAKEMIDLREDQIERYNEYLKEQRSMKRK